MEIFVIFLLLILNGLLAMYEIALVSSSKIRLEAFFKAGRSSAYRVLRQLEHPEQTLSTIQIGITLVGIVSGAFGGMALSEDVQLFVEKVPFLQPYSHEVSLVLTVTAITYLSLVIGELVPKAMALSHPERYAMLLSGAVAFLTRICFPFVCILSLSTKAVGRLLGVRTDQSRPLTQEEIKMMLKESSDQGVIGRHESEMLRDVFRFSNRCVAELMTPRHELIVLHPGDSRKVVIDTITRNSFSKYPLIGKSRDDVLGVIAVKDIVSLLAADTGERLPLQSKARPALFLPESIGAQRAVELFKLHKTKFGVVVNEYGGTEGIVTLNDLTENIFGDIVEGHDTKDSEIVYRKDGSLLIDGSMNLNDFFEKVEMSPDSEVAGLYFNTVGGFVMYNLGRMPHTGDCFTYKGLKCEVVDMDGERVDKLLVMPTCLN